MESEEIGIWMIYCFEAFYMIFIMTLSAET